MAYEVEPMDKNNSGGFFAKFHDVFTLTCSANNKADTDIPSASAAKNNSKGEGNIGFVQEAFLGFVIVFLGILIFMVYIHTFIFYVYCIIFGLKAYLD